MKNYLFTIITLQFSIFYYYGFSQITDDDLNLPFTFCDEFSEGLAFVIYEDPLTNETIRGYINKDGNLQIKIDNETIGGKFHNAHAWLIHNTPEGKQYGFINREGEFVIQPEFRIRTFGKGDKIYIDIRDFCNEGVTWVWNGKYALLNHQGELLTDFTFDKVYSFINNLAIVAIRDEQSETGYREGIIDFNGKLITKIEYESITLNADSNFMLFYKNKHYGYLNQQGINLTEIKFDYAMPFSEGFAFVRIGKSFMIIDQAGNTKVTLPDNFIPVGIFKEGLAKIRYYDKYGFIDKAGNVVISPDFDDATDFKFGLSIVRKKDNYFIMRKSGCLVQLQFDKSRNIDFYFNVVDNNFIFVAKKEKHKNNLEQFYCGYIDHNGKIIIPLVFDNIGEFSSGLTWFKKDHKFGFIDTRGNVLIQPLFDKVDNFREGFARVIKNSKYGYLKPNGQFLQIKSNSEN